MNDCIKNVMPIKGAHGPFTLAFYLAVIAINTCQHVKQREDHQDPCRVV